MKRAPIVLTGTALGLVGVLSYHTAGAPSSLVGAASASTGNSSSAAASGTSTAASQSSATSSTASTATTAKTSTRSATGEDVNYQYGDIEVKVTMSGGKLTNVSVVKLDVTDPRSQSIDQMAVPQLTREALAARSAKIDGVSGASYTSAAYEQSLQSALDKLS